MQLDTVKNAAYDLAKQRPWRPIYIRHEQRQGWTAKLPIYVVWCDACGKWSEMHPQGFSGRIHCRGCRGYAALNAESAIKKALFMVAMTAFPRATVGCVRLYSRLRHGKRSVALAADIKQAHESDAVKPAAAERSHGEAADESKDPLSIN